MEKKKEIVEIPITQSETYIPTHEELRAIKEAHLSKHDDSFHGDDGDDEEVSNAMDVSDNVHIYTSITSTSQMNIDGVKIPKKKLEVSERSSTNQIIIEQNSSSSSSSRDTSGISTTDIRIRKKQRILSDPSDDAILPKTYGLDSIFSVEGLLSYEDWSPQISKNTSLVHLLNNFSLEDYQTVALKMSVTPNNGRWSVNVCPEDPMEMTDVYIHFNPRYKSNEVVLNDVQGTWGGSVLTCIYTHTYIYA